MIMMMMMMMMMIAVSVTGGHIEISVGITKCMSMKDFKAGTKCVACSGKYFWRLK